LSLLMNYFEHDVRRKIFDASDARQRFVYGNGAYRDRRRLDDSLADLGYVASGGQVHDCIGAIFHAILQLVEFFSNVRSGGGSADVRVAFASGRNADTHGLKRRMIDVRRNDEAAARNRRTDELRSKLLPARHILHLFGDDALSGIMHLRPYRIA